MLRSPTPPATKKGKKCAVTSYRKKTCKCHANWRSYVFAVRENIVFLAFLFAEIPILWLPLSSIIIKIYHQECLFYVGAKFYCWFSKPQNSRIFGFRFGSVSKHPFNDCLVRTYFCSMEHIKIEVFDFVGAFFHYIFP